MGSSRSTTLTLSSGSAGERIVIVPDAPSASRGVSVHSPVASASVSSSAGSPGSAGSDGWTHVTESQYYDDDGIEPEDSASRSRHSSSRRRAEVPEPARRHSSRRSHRPRSEPEEPAPLPRQPSSHKHRSSSKHHHRRHGSRRIPSDESASTVASHDDYPPYGHRGMPQSRAYPPQSGYRNVPGHGGYPPTMTSGYPGSSISAGYPNPHDPFNQQLVAMPPQDPFYPHPAQNPFTGGGAQANPFSPMETASTSSYFHTDPHAPPMHHPVRPAPPGRPQSYMAPGYPGSEMVAHSQFYHPTSNPYSLPYPGMPGYGQMPYMVPPSHPGSPGAELERLRALEAEQIERQKAELRKKEKEAEENKVKEREDKSLKEIEALKDLIRKHEEDRNAREAALLKKAEADAAAAAAKKAAEEAEKQKIEEIDAAKKAAKAEAEKAAKEEADKLAAEHKTKLEEATKAAEDAEKKRKELEEAAEKAKPTPDSLKDPIRFNDAVNRKFSFPWHLCKTWKGMDGLIKQAFLHVDVIGDHVHQGHYDLMGPDGEIILPQVWDTMIKPGWEISMHMWPMPEPEAAKDVVDVPVGDPFAGLNITNLTLSGDKPKRGKSGKKRAKSSDQVVNVAPMGVIPPPVLPAGVSPDDPMAGYPMPGMMVEERRPANGKGKAPPKKPSGFSAWMMGGARPPKKDDEKLELVKHGKSANNGSSATAAASNDPSCTVM